MLLDFFSEKDKAEIEVDKARKNYEEAMPPEATPSWLDSDVELVGDVWPVCFGNWRQVGEYEVISDQTFPKYRPFSGSIRDLMPGDDLEIARDNHDVDVYIVTRIMGTIAQGNLRVIVRRATYEEYKDRPYTNHNTARVFRS